MIEYFAVFDAVAERYINPFGAMNVGVALRGFEEACRDPNGNFINHPEDYSLWLVGSFDPELGILSGVTPTKVANAITYIAMNTIEELRDSLASEEVG